jgi:hypothetical protein
MGDFIMKLDFYIAEKHSCNFDSPNQKTVSVSFGIDVLNKYRNSNFKIDLNEEVGTLESLIDGWEIQIDVNNKCGYLTTWLDELFNLPDIEKKHFAEYNIYARELSQIAKSRWVDGVP